MPDKSAMHTTGNPVFDFQAACRRRGTRVQKALTLCGLVSLAAGLAGVVLWPDACVWVWMPLPAGAVLLAAGIAHGYAWRSRLRADFRKQHSIYDEDKNL
ncbi:MAG: hypothetical protein L6R28_03355 [Planctomycetes bacterium]|nr:hypothetical protein [Planctomycetota bacterium]